MHLKSEKPIGWNTRIVADDLYIGGTVVNAHSKSGAFPFNSESRVHSLRSAASQKLSDACCVIDLLSRWSWIVGHQRKPAPSRDRFPAGADSISSDRSWRKTQRSTTGMTALPSPHLPVTSPCARLRAEVQERTVYPSGLWARIRRNTTPSKILHSVRSLEWIDDQKQTHEVACSLLISEDITMIDALYGARFKVSLAVRSRLGIEAARLTTLLSLVLGRWAGNH